MSAPERSPTPVEPYPLPAARAAFCGAFSALARLAGRLTDDQLLYPSRCKGWAVCDVICHVHIGAQDVLVALASVTDRPADTDFVSYWRKWGSGGDGALEHARFVRLVSSAYRRPTGMAAHFGKTVAACLRRAADAQPQWNIDFQDYVLPVSDLLATWAVEAAIHQLDIGLELPDAGSPPDSALGLVRATLDGLLGQPAPAQWSDEAYALKGSGRVPLTPAEADRLGPGSQRFPLLG